ncbi:MAG: 3-deoxy-7-phosphoheptulonate synthase, partial [Dehalococcoidia bacterium]
MPVTSNVNVSRMDRLLPPDAYLEELPITPEVATVVAHARQQIQDILAGDDDRMVMVIGPCSLHDERAGLEYAERLASLSERVRDRALIVMRVYF